MKKKTKVRKVALSDLLCGFTMHINSCLYCIGTGLGRRVMCAVRARHDATTGKVAAECASSASGFISQLDDAY